MIEPEAYVLRCLMEAQEGGVSPKQAKAECGCLGESSDKPAFHSVTKPNQKEI